MNKVYLSGTIADPPMLTGGEGGPSHSVFQLCVSHKTAKGEIRRELYAVNAWNGAAQWVATNLKQGQKIALQGYLTQKAVRTAEGTFQAVEVTSQEFLPMASGLFRAPAPLPQEEAV